MRVEELIEELRQLPPTAFVAVMNGSDAGVSIDRVTYAGGEAVIYLDVGEEDDDDEDDDLEENDDHADQA